MSPLKYICKYFINLSVIYCIRFYFQLETDNCDVFVLSVKICNACGEGHVNCTKVGASVNCTCKDGFVPVPDLTNANLFKKCRGKYKVLINVKSCIHPTINMLVQTYCMF